MHQVVTRALRSVSRARSTGAENGLWIPARWVALAAWLLASCQTPSEVFFPPDDSSLSEPDQGDDPAPNGDATDLVEEPEEDAVDQALPDSSGPDLGPMDAGDGTDGPLDLLLDSADVWDQGIDPQADADLGTDLEGYHPARYPGDRTHSPLTSYVIDRLLDIAAVGADLDDAVFIKVGDSITQSTSFLNCFAGSYVDLAGRTELQATLDHFLSGVIGSTTPFNRDSAAAEVGKTAWWAVSGTPSPLQTELEAASPRLAVVMFGTNDIGWYAPDYGRMLRWYSDAMMTLVDRLIEEGTIPILMSIPPRDDEPDLDDWVPTVNQVIRGLAQARQVPFVDFHRELVGLPSHGLGGDGVHPNLCRVDGYYRPCFLTSQCLQYGYNVRNLVTLEALHRVRLAVIEGSFDPDPGTDPIQGDGSPQAPFEIDSLPFTHRADTSLSPYSRLSQYTGCLASQDESGPEYLYRLQLDEPAALRALVVSRSAVDVDLHLLDSSASAEGCIERNHTVLDRTLAAGEYYLSVDTFVSGGVPQSGEYLLVVLPCQPGDSACQ
ncbi:MAG: SGNH/GDSL hydrolase family protein [Bradymonadales bacterium]|nr:SGNH/GDSL hydrolase family protein [Bradymonadales bacterium]